MDGATQEENGFTLFRTQMTHVFKLFTPSTHAKNIRHHMDAIFGSDNQERFGTRATSSVGRREEEKGQKNNRKSSAKDKSPNVLI